MSIESEKQKMYPEDFFMTENQKKIRQRKIFISKKVSELREEDPTLNARKIAKKIESDEAFQREFPGTSYDTIYQTCLQEMPDVNVTEYRRTIIGTMVSELRKKHPNAKASNIASMIESDEAFQREFPGTSFATIYHVCLQEMSDYRGIENRTALICKMASDLREKYPHFKTSNIAKMIQSDEEFKRKYPNISYMTIYQTCRNAGF